MIRNAKFLIPAVLMGVCLGGSASAQAPAQVPGKAAPPASAQPSAPAAPAAPGTPAAPAASPAAPASETADSLLKRVDAQLNAFKDATFVFKLLIKEASGAREVQFSTLQMGKKRLVRFLSPGDIKGMGFLIENPETMYALLPGFNNRVRRIGTHQMSQSFMGSDVNSDDMSVLEFSPLYQPKLVGTDGDKAILELTLRPGKQAAYPRIKMWVERQRAVITRMEYMDASGKKLRTQIREDYRQDNTSGGTAHYSPGRMIFIDHVRNNHESELILVSSKTNTGLGDDQFTVRALQRND